MIEIRPFCGIIFNRGKVKDLTGVLTPPYDVISSKEQEEYYRSSPYNIIRIILGKDYPGDNSRQNKYIRARNFFHSWIKKGVLIRDKKPSLYVYEQSGRIGFLALLRLEEFGKSVFPHEETFPKHKKECLKLINACRANFNPIFSLYSPGNKIIDRVIKEKMKGKPLFSICFNGVLNKLWRIEKDGEIEKIATAMQKTRVFIADGHHRYETALEYTREIKRRNPSKTSEESYNFVMMMFVKMGAPKLDILPTHRLLKTDCRLKIADCRLQKYFDVRSFESLEKMLWVLHRMKYSFGMYQEKGKYYVLSVKNMKEVERKFESDIPACWRELNMVILHHFFFKHILKANLTPQETIKYTTSPQEAVMLVNRNEYQIAFFLNSIKPEVVGEIALSGEKMPHKATYFYPKPLSGFVINKM